MGHQNITSTFLFVQNLRYNAFKGHAYARQNILKKTFSKNQLPVPKDNSHAAKLLRLFYVVAND